MPVDVDVGQHPAVAEVAVQLIGELFGDELLGAWGPLTVMTGPGADAWCTFHMPTAPTATAMTATSGNQALSRTALPTERWLIRSPPVPDFVFSLRARLLGKADPTTAIYQLA